MGRFVPGKMYPRDEFFQMVAEGEVQNLALKGYVARASQRPDGTIEVGFVRASESANPGVTPGSGVWRGNSQHVYDVRAKGLDKSDLIPIIRRTPQQRVESMLLRILDGAKEAGTIPGFSEDELRDIAGGYWLAGHTEVTVDMVRKVVAHFLRRAEREQALNDRKRVTRQGPSD